MPFNSSNALIDQSLYIIFTAIVCVVLITTHIVFLFTGARVKDRMPSRWAGLNATPLWWFWFVSFILTVASYCTFFSLFIINDTRASKNSMYGAVCSLSLFFCLSEAYWPYLLRRAEDQTELVYDGDELSLQYLEYCCCCPCCIPVGSSRWAVIINIAFSSLLSVLMLVLFIVGALDSDSGIEMHFIEASLSYIVFHCVVVDLVFWGYTWFNKQVYEWKDGRIHQRSNLGSEASAYSALWSGVTLFDQVPLLHATCNNNMNGI